MTDTAIAHIQALALHEHQPLLQNLVSLSSGVPTNPLTSNSEYGHDYVPPAADAAPDVLQSPTTTMLPSTKLPTCLLVNNPYAPLADAADQGAEDDDKFFDDPNAAGRHDDDDDQFFDDPNTVGRHDDNDDHDDDEFDDPNAFSDTEDFNVAGALVGPMPPDATTEDGGAPMTDEEDKGAHIDAEANEGAPMNGNQAQPEDGKRSANERRPGTTPVQPPSPATRNQHVQASHGHAAKRQIVFPPGAVAAAGPQFRPTHEPGCRHRNHTKASQA